MEGLQDGLTHFSQPSRAALIYAVSSQGPIKVHDPQLLLNGHEPIIKELFLESQIWQEKAADIPRMDQPGFLQRENNLQLAGLISYGGRSQSIYYQMWFTEHHPDMCSVGPTERWLEQAAWRLGCDVASEDILYTGVSGAFLREYATHAVRDHIIDEMNVEIGWDASLRVYPVLDAVLGISRTLEEGAWPRGELVFTEPVFVPEIDFVIEFSRQEQPSIENHKHVRKLLQTVEGSDRHLISDGKHIIGIADGRLPRFYISAAYQGQYGFLKIDGEAICSIADGRFYSTTQRAKLVEVEEALLEVDLSDEEQSGLFQVVADIVHSAQAHKYGCTVILDLNSPPLDLQGQRLKKPLDLTREKNLSLARSLSKVDGALHIGADIKLHRFGCLMDGTAIAGEDRARGARYNSALRFTTAQKKLIVVVVSSDKPVSIIRDGLALNAQCRFNPVSLKITSPPDLESWLTAKGI
jgi:hypothetical protein